MIMLYFSGTGNSQYIAELFGQKTGAACHSIEKNIDFAALIAANETIGFCYPVYASRAPRIMRNFVAEHLDKLKNKNIIIFCTQMLFSGDGARSFAALFPQNHLQVIYAEHFFMPNNVSNVFILPLASDKLIKRYIACSERRMQAACHNIKNGKIKKRGFNVFSQFLGLIQGVFLTTVEKMANNSVKITASCNNCQICIAVCPMQNLIYEDGCITHKHDCTMCYRCVNKCPQKAITVGYHGKVKRQYLYMLNLRKGPPPQ